MGLGFWKDGGLSLIVNFWAFCPGYEKDMIWSRESVDDWRVSVGRDLGCDATATDLQDLRG